MQLGKELERGFLAGCGEQVINPEGTRCFRSLYMTEISRCLSWRSFTISYYPSEPASSNGEAP